MGWSFASFMTDIVFAGKVISPLVGGLITGTEFGLGGFGAGFGGAIGSGESIGEAFAAGGLGFAGSFALGFAAGYSYTAGWQSVLHGADIAAHNAQVIEAQQRRVANMMAMLDEARSKNGLIGQIETQKLIVKYSEYPSAKDLARWQKLSTYNTSRIGHWPSGVGIRNIGIGSPYPSGIRTPFTSAAMGGLLIKPLVVEGTSLTSAYLISGGNAKPGLFIYGLIKTGIKTLLGDEYGIPTPWRGIQIPWNPKPAY